jgi:hypothetical protein
LNLLPDICDFVFIARAILNWAPSKGDNAEERRATLQDNCRAAFQVAHKIVPLIFLASCQHTYSSDSNKVAAIMVKLFDQTLTADVEMLYIKAPVFGVRDGAPLMDSTHPYPIALAASARHIALAAVSTCLDREAV